MDNRQFEEVSRRLQEQAREYITDQAHLASQAQRQYLASRSAALHQMAELVSLQAGLQDSSHLPAQPCLFNRGMLEEFAAGSIERCLGEAYAVFRERRAPRIPNGDLLLM